MRLIASRSPRSSRKMRGVVAAAPGPTSSGLVDSRRRPGAGVGRRRGATRRARRSRAARPLVAVGDRLAGGQAGGLGHLGRDPRRVRRLGRGARGRPSTAAAARARARRSTAASRASRLIRLISGSQSRAAASTASGRGRRRATPRGRRAGRPPWRPDRARVGRRRRRLGPAGVVVVGPLGRAERVLGGLAPAPGRGSRARSARRRSGAPRRTAPESGRLRRRRRLVAADRPRPVPRSRPARSRSADGRVGAGPADRGAPPAASVARRRPVRRTRRVPPGSRPQRAAASGPAPAEIGMPTRSAGVDPSGSPRRRAPGVHRRSRGQNVSFDDPGAAVGHRDLVAAPVGRVRRGPARARPRRRRRRPGWSRGGGDRVLRDGHADLAPCGRPCPDDLDEGGAAGDAEDEAQGQEHELADGHAARISRVVLPRARSRLCGPA